MTALVAALTVAVVLLTVLVVGLLRSHAEILRALHELGAGLELDRSGGRRDGPVGPVDLTVEGVVRPRAGGSDQAAPVVGTTLDDEAVALALGGQEDDTLLAFLTSGCATCQAFWSAFRDPVDVPGGARIVVVTKDLDEESESALRARDPHRVPLVLSGETWDRYEVPGSPYFVYVDGPSGRIVGEGSGASWPQVAGLMQQALADGRTRARRSVGGGPAGVSGNGAAREQRDDAALATAGIVPGHPSLYAVDPQPHEPP